MHSRLQIEWQQTADQLKLFYRWERNPHRKIRLQALWHLRCGKRLQDVADIITGVSPNLFNLGRKGETPVFS